MDQEWTWTGSGRELDNISAILNATEKLLYAKEAST